MNKQLVLALACSIAAGAAVSCRAAANAWKGKPTVTVHVPATGWKALYLIHGTDEWWKPYAADPKAIVPLLGVRNDLYWCYQQYAPAHLSTRQNDNLPIVSERRDPPGGYPYWSVAAIGHPDGSATLTVEFERELFDARKSGGLAVVAWIGGNTYRCHRFDEEALENGKDLATDIGKERVQ